ncbi:hypothetical protein SARC_10941, partial [Sphaeroforma arctica JP610]
MRTTTDATHDYMQIEESHETANIETSHEADPHHMDLDVSTGSLEKGVESVTIEGVENGG